MKKIVIFLLLVMAGCAPVSTGKPLPFKKIIFTDREKICFKILDRSGNITGEATIEIKKERNQNLEFYKFTSFIKEGKLTSSTRCDIHPHKLVPIFSEKIIRGKKGVYKITSMYKSGKNFADIVIESKKIKEKLQLEVPLVFYENETVIFILRNICPKTWKKERKLRFNVIIPQVGQHCVVEANYIRDEKIKYQDGFISTYKIKINPENMQAHYIWYETEHPHRIIKYKNKDNTYFLLKHLF